MNTRAQALPPGGNVGMFGDNSVALHWEVNSWQQHVASQTMNVSQSLLLPGVSAIENARAPIRIPWKYLIPGLSAIQAVWKIVSKLDSLIEFIRECISRIND